MQRIMIIGVALAFITACSTLFGSGSNGSSGTLSPMTEAQVAGLLHEQGYADLSDLRFDGKDWTASATRDGKPVKVNVDRYGIIHIL